MPECSQHFPYFHIQKEEFRPDTGLMRRMMHIGLPLALQNAMIAFSCVMLQTVINSFGAMIVAVFTATNRIENLVNQIYIAANTALSNYTAQNLGAGNTDRVRAGTRCCLRITACFSFAMILVMYVCGRLFMSWFVTDLQVIETGARALKLISLFFLFWGALYVFRGTLNGAGNASFALISGVLEVVGRMGCAFLLTAVPFIGQWGTLFEGSEWGVHASSEPPWLLGGTGKQENAGYPFSCSLNKIFLPFLSPIIIGFLYSIWRMTVSSLLLVTYIP